MGSEVACTFDLGGSVYSRGDQDASKCGGGSAAEALVDELLQGTAPTRTTRPGS